MSVRSSVPQPPVTAGLTLSGLRCLLAIWQLSQENPQISSRQIAAVMQVKPPTVCRLLDPLIEQGLIKKEPYGKVELTLLGKQTAMGRQRRVNQLHRISMKRLGLDHRAALQAALFFASSMDEANQQAMLRSALHPSKEAIP